jgi:hypothetical protein
MQLGFVLETGGLLDEPHAEKTGIEIHIRLHFAGDGGDVMYARNHRKQSVLLGSGEKRQN